MININYGIANKLYDIDFSDVIDYILNLWITLHLMQ